jgi:hypothetical protein
LQLGGSIGFGDKKIGQIPHRLPHAVAHGRFLEPVDQSADGAEPDSYSTAYVISVALLPSS